MFQHHVARLAFTCLLLALASCGGDGEDAEVRKHFAAGANRDHGIQVLNPSKPELPFYHSLGNVAYGKQYGYTYELRNVTDEAFVIDRTEPACACSRVTAIRAWKGESPEDGFVEGDLSKRGNIVQVEPGQRFSIDIRIDTLRVNPNAGKLAVLRVYTNSPVEPHVTFELNFFPEKLFELANPAIKLGDIPLGGGIGGTVHIYSRKALNSARLVDVLSTSEGLEAELELISGQESNWNLNVTTVGQVKLGPFRGKVVLRTTDSMGQGKEGRLEVPVSGRVVPQVMMYPTNLSFGQVKHGKAGTMTAGIQGLAPGHRIQISGVRFEGPSAPHLEVELERIAENTFGRSLRIDAHLRCKETAPKGPIDATITLDLVDEAQESIVRKVHGVVE